MRANIVLLDIDGTIVHTSGADCALCDALYDCVARKHGIDRRVAAEHVHAVFDPGEQDPAPYLAELDIDPVAYRRRAMDMMRERAIVYDDAVELIRQLKVRDVRMYPATTNGPTAIIVKLALAGLADINGATCFEDLFGGSTVCPAGKSGPAFYTAILRRIGATGDDVIMIGDDQQHDVDDAHAAGIRQTVLIDRSQTDAWVANNGSGLRVRSLTEIISIISGSCS
jgi:phosphoglycolate phosphatase-like HAD superfamily hydrolase